MKLRWWIVGTIAAVAGGVFIVKHVAENKEKYFRLVDNENEKKYSECSSDHTESEFEEIDFLT